jgi:hypothetical protein
MRPLWPHHLVSGRTANSPNHNPSCLRAQSSEGWDPSWERGIFQPRFRSVTTDPGSGSSTARVALRITLCFLLPSYWLDFQRGADRHQALSDESPECHQQLPGQSDNGDALDAAASVADPVAIPSTQGTVRLVAQP